MSTTTTTTPSATATHSINDRVPSLEPIKEPTSLIIAPSSSSDSSKTIEPISVTFAAPPLPTQPSPHIATATAKSENGKTTATFTIPIPIASTISTSITLPTALTTSTHKTEHTSFNYDRPKAAADNHHAKQPITSESPIVKFALSALDTDVTMSATDDDKTDQKTIQPAAPAPATHTATTFDHKLNVGKRSLLDLDNASSLSLADKLRNEANKYSDENRSNATNSVGDTNHSQNHRIGNAGSDSETTTSGLVTHATLHLNSGASVPSATERRPSWRLKLDSGSKVRIMFCFFLLLQYSVVVLSHIQII